MVTVAKGATSLRSSPFRESCFSSLCLSVKKRFGTKLDPG
jgi:hypothetical protein